MPTACVMWNSHIAKEREKLVSEQVNIPTFQDTKQTKQQELQNLHAFLNGVDELANYQVERAMANSIAEQLRSKIKDETLSMNLLDADNLAESNDMMN